MLLGPWNWGNSTVTLPVSLHFYLFPEYFISGISGWGQDRVGRSNGNFRPSTCIMWPEGWIRAGRGGCNWYWVLSTPGVPGPWLQRACQDRKRMRGVWSLQRLNPKKEWGCEGLIRRSYERITILEPSERVPWKVRWEWTWSLYIKEFYETNAITITFDWHENRQNDIKATENRPEYVYMQDKKGLLRL